MLNLRAGRLRKRSLAQVWRETRPKLGLPGFSGLGAGITRLRQGLSGGGFSFQGCESLRRSRVLGSVRNSISFDVSEMVLVG